MAAYDGEKRAAWLEAHPEEYRKACKEARRHEPPDDPGWREVMERRKPARRECRVSVGIRTCRSWF